MRLTKYREDMCQTAEDFLAEGYTQMSLAAELDVVCDKMWNWKKKYPEFSEAIQRGLQRGLRMFEGLLMEKLKNKRSKVHENLLMFTLTRRFNSVYGERVKQDVEVKPVRFEMVQVGNSED